MKESGMLHHIPGDTRQGPALEPSLKRRHWAASPPLPATAIPVPPSILAAVASPAQAGGRPRWEGTPPPRCQPPCSIIMIPLQGAAPLPAAHSAPS